MDYRARPVEIRKETPLPAENLLEDTAGMLRPTFESGPIATHQRPLGAVACCSHFLLTCDALRMASLHFKGHRSVYCSCDKDCDGDAAKIREGKYGLEAIFMKYGVDFWINGHEHDYEVITPPGTPLPRIHLHLHLVNRFFLLAFTPVIYNVLKPKCRVEGRDLRPARKLLEPCI